MNDYKKLAIKYLKMNKKRSIITVIGVVTAVTILYTMLNLGWSALLTQRKSLREKQDYEIVFLTENQNQIEQIISDSKVKSALVGTYYDYDYSDPVMYKNALYINTTNPYRMEKIQSELEEKYNVKSKLNKILAWTYLQGGNGNMTVIMILISLLLSFIFAIFGVGIVRNSIQLCTLEQIKDYGNMRCIGASKQQLKSIIYMEGAILELTGNAIGIVMGFFISYTIGLFLKLEVGIHVIPMLPILIAFLGDLYFAMKENCKVVVNMTPINAIRGEFSIGKEKLKARKNSIFGKLFGVEGEYAYKSIMRNPKRFYKTVWSLGIAGATFIAIAGCVNSLNNVIKEKEDSFKYYQVYFENIKEPFETADEIKSSLPSTSVLNNISELKEVTRAKRIYSSTVSLVDWESFFEQYTQQYIEESVPGNIKSSIKENYIKNKDFNSLADLINITCYGYDEEDYKRYKNLLVDGTLDVSENGIILMNSGKIETLTMNGLSVETTDIPYTNYKVGDTINIVDMDKLQMLLEKELPSLKDKYTKEKSVLSKLPYEDEDLYPTEEQLEYKYYELKIDLYIKCIQQLIDEGSYKIYTVEGILKDDSNHINDGEPRIILPLKYYYTFTGTNESIISGMQYHFDKFSYTHYVNAFIENQEYSYDYDGFILGYPEFMSMLDKAKKIIFGIRAIILFVVLMNTFNIINTTASNLHLRKKELAQLRVIGISRKHLIKMVMLEGIISSITASIIGIAIGNLIGYFTFKMIFGILWGLDYVFPIASTIIGIIVLTFILCGSIYVPLQGLKQDIASDLTLE